MWPENERAMAFFQRVGTRWLVPAMGGIPQGLRWEAIYPLMEQLKLPPDEWDELHLELMLMEESALDTMREFAPPPKK